MLHSLRSEKLGGISNYDEKAVSSSPLSPLQNMFDEVWVISLSRRADRLARFWKEINKSNWPFRRPAVFSAIDGDRVGVPKFWQTGGGSYGCLRSHLVLLERAIQNGLSSMLVVEDDAVFMPTFENDVRNFFANVPSDWECLMLGGQHVDSKPTQVKPGVVRAGGGGGIQRTHCYALRGSKAMKALYLTWANAAVHCDWVMGPCMSKFNTYAPDPFLVGQSDGTSDISGAQNPTKFWRPPTGFEPVVILRSPRSVLEELRQKGWHSGYTRDPATGIDVGLRDIFADTALSFSDRNKKFKAWINMIQWEANSLAEPAICTIWHPDINKSEVQSVVEGKVIEVNAQTASDAIKQLPPDIHIPVQNRQKVIWLRAPREVLESLRAQGLHAGYWRDEITGEDNGVRKLMAETKDKGQRIEGLRQTVKILQEEARTIQFGIPTLWHNEITADMLAPLDFEIIEIEANTVEEAMESVLKIRNETA